MKVAVLGGSGVLGGAVAAIAAAAGHDVITVSRRPPQLAGIHHRVADVVTREGLAAAFAGADAIIDGTNATKHAREVLVDGTRNVLDAAHAAGVAHFVGISIVGIDDSPVAYYRVKVAQERAIADGPVPWSLLRATQFHDLIPRFARGRFGIVIAPCGWRLQPIDVREVAAILVDVAGTGPAKRLPDVGGPEIVPVIELARVWQRAAHVRRLNLHLPLPGVTGAYLRSGQMCTPARAVGTITFASWLGEHYKSTDDHATQ
jgi:uncharacterized protein YbjT (DUF2867 family)